MINLRKLRYGLLLYAAFDVFFGGVCGGFFPLTPLVAAQFTQVSGTATDPNGLPYANGTIAATLVISGTPTLSGQPYTPPSQAVGLNSTGGFVMQLADNTQLSPGGSTWKFQVCSGAGGIPPAAGTGPVCFFVPALTISGSSQNITAQINAAAVSLSRGGGNTLGVKLRRLARVAQSSNALISPPLAPVAAWAISTAYVQGQVVSNGGNLYYCITSGTSAGSGGPSGTGAAPITDNTVTWFFFGIPVTTSASVLAPTVTTNTSQPGGLSTSYTLTSNPSLFQYPGTLVAKGGSPTPYCFATITVVTNGNCSTTQTAGFYSVSFWTDAPKFAITTNNATSLTWRVLINNQYVNLSGTVPANANPSYNEFDFSAAGGRLPRLVTFQSWQAVTVSGVYMTAIDSIWAPSRADNIRAIFVGDSIIQGTNVTVPDLDCGNQVGQLLGWNDVWISAQGATGYIANDSGNGYPFVQRVTDVTSFSPDIVVVMGGTNDSGNSASVITAAVLAYLQALRAGLPTTPIIVTGIANSQGANALNINAENAIAAGVNAFNDSRTYFIPIVTDTTPWFSGSGNVSAPSGSGNNDAYGYQVPHFTQTGYSYLARKLADKIRQIEYQIP